MTHAPLILTHVVVEHMKRTGIFYVTEENIFPTRDSLSLNFVVIDQTIPSMAMNNS